MTHTDQPSTLNYHAPNGAGLSTHYRPAGRLAMAVGAFSVATAGLVAYAALAWLLHTSAPGSAGLIAMVTPDFLVVAFLLALSALYIIGGRKVRHGSMAWTAVVQVTALAHGGLMLTYLAVAAAARAQALVILVALGMCALLAALIYKCQRVKWDVAGVKDVR